jgi:bifunctional DNA-binding transcriptional regulator/antitoxin component of YhaV-PrlF toxin-antitoxin module
MDDVIVRIAAGGRIVIPADFRRELGADVGDEIILRLAGGEIRILTRDQAVRKAQALVRNQIPASRSLVKELLQERRKEAKRE